MQRTRGTADRGQAQNRQDPRQMPGTHTAAATEFPSLIDDLTFLAELDKLEAEPLASPIARSVSKSVRAGAAATAPAGVEPVIPRDVNRWHLHPPPGVELAPIAQRGPSQLPVVLVVLIGLCAGATGSAIVFYQRFEQLLALFAN
jgi:hypothetical protein